MRLRTLFASVSAAALAAVMLVSPAQAQSDEHDHQHENGILTLEIIDSTTTDDEDAGDIVITGHGDKGHTYPPDIDGYVPTSYGGDCYDNVLAYASWHSVGDWYIVYDKCEMERHGAGQNDWDRVGRHEKAHTDGWGHYEEPRDRNAAFEPGIVICRC